MNERKTTWVLNHVHYECDECFSSNLYFLSISQVWKKAQNEKGDKIAKNGCLNKYLLDLYSEDDRLSELFHVN